MSAPRLKPIPIPPAQQFRHFKMTYLPGLVFGGALVIIGVLWQDRMAAPTLVGPGAGTLAGVNAHQVGAPAGSRETPFQASHAGGLFTNVLIADTTRAEGERVWPVNLRLPTALQLCPDELEDGSVTPGTQ